jgi:NADH:quinone reductase (non-electrogenic)
MSSQVMSNSAHVPRVLILGGGFGGVAVAKELESLGRKLPGGVEVTMISKTNYLLFLPMLPEAASGSLELTHILSPLRSLLPRTKVRVETVESIDLEKHTVTTVQPSTRREQVLEWDYLVIAVGNIVELGAMAGVAHHGLPIKTIGDALHIRNRALEMLDGAEASTNAADRQRLLTFVVAGAGFSGVEVAAELNAFLRDATRAYHTISPKDIRLILLHGGKRILPELSPGLAAFAQRELEKQGVEVRLETRIMAATAQEVICGGGERIPTHSLIVAFGAGPNAVVRALDVPKERGRIKVEQTLQVIGHPRVWAVGDCAAATNTSTGLPSPPTAQFALRQGRTAGRNVAAAIAGRPLENFTFGGLGQLVSLGGHTGVAEMLGRIRLSGILAWAMWRGFYLFRLPGIERKLRVFLDWLLDLFMSRDLAQLNVQRTERVAMAHYEPGQVIVRQGDPADAFYVIMDGKVQVVREQDDGTEVEVDQMMRGDAFGEVGLLQHRRRNATIRALTPVDVVALTSGDFDLLAGSWEHLGQLLQRTAADRFEPQAAQGNTVGGS